MAFHNRILQGVKSLFGADETRAVSGSLADPYLLAFLGGSPTAAGVSVTPETAMRCSTSAACIRIWSETVAQIPLHAFVRLPGGGRERITDHPAARVLRQPSDFQTASEFKALIGSHLAAFGNAFAWVSRDADGNPVELISLAPSRITVRSDSSSMAPIYLLSNGSGGQEVLDRQALLHVRGPGLDVHVGASPVELAKEAIGLSEVMSGHASRLFANGAKPAGIIEYSKMLSDEVAKRLSASLQGMWSGNNSGKTAILEDGMKFTQLSLSSVDSQFLELRRFQIAEISRFWRIPLSLLNDLERVTHSNAEAMALQFLQFSVLPVLRNISDALALTLLRPEERDTLFFDWVVDDFVRADLATRMQAYATGISHGLLSPDEARALDNRGPVPDGSGAVFTRPVNVAAVPTTPAPTAAEAAQ